MNINGQNAEHCGYSAAYPTGRELGVKGWLDAGGTVLAEIGVSKNVIATHEVSEIVRL